jgi:mRNA interferase HigB
MADKYDDKDPPEGVRRPKKNHLISRKKFRTFVEKHPEAGKDRAAFLRWCKLVEQALWTTFGDVRSTFGSADQVGDRVVFNLGGNKYRVVARINYKRATVYLRHVLTHDEYDEEHWKSDP